MGLNNIGNRSISEYEGHKSIKSKQNPGYKLKPQLSQKNKRTPIRLMCNNKKHLTYIETTI